MTNLLRFLQIVGGLGIVVFGFSKLRDLVVWVLGLRFEEFGYLTDNDLANVIRDTPKVIDFLADGLFWIALGLFIFVFLGRIDQIKEKLWKQQQ